MHFQLTNLLALIPFVAGIALPAPSTDTQSLSDLAHYETHTTADGVTCLAIYLYIDKYYGPNNAGVPGCGVDLWNRLYIDSNGDSQVQQACGGQTCNFRTDGVSSGYSYAGYNVCPTTCYGG
ncbi:hypothetical protein BDR22DRAFT_975811 [Usnea florida]